MKAKAESKNADFVHLHVHTEYSFLDGAINTKSLIGKAASLGMPAVAMTDHGNMYGAVDFYQRASAAGIKPIIGCEAYMAEGSMRERANTIAGKRSYHITLLARNDDGYHNLVKLCSTAHLDGMYYGKPRIDKNLLAEHSEGLICLSGCISGQINQRILAEDDAGARAIVSDYADIFGKDCFYLEIQDSGMEDQRLCTQKMRSFAREFDLPLVATNDVHFLNKEDYSAHEVMICIGTGSKLEDEDRLHYPREVYFKDPDEMARVFREVPEALRSTLDIAEMCEVKMKFDPNGIAKYPRFTPPNNAPLDEYFEAECLRGLEERYGKRASDEKIRRRLSFEIEIIKNMGFVSYFCIVADFINWARKRGISVGPGRGSAAGSLAAYCLGITDICPLRFGLVFERFLNPERISPPDVDIDFCQSRRGEVIEYVRQKYGQKCVSHIITFGSLGAKMVVRDVARVMGLSYAEGDRLAKLIPNDLGMTLAKAKKQNTELAEVLKTEERTSGVWEMAEYLEGLKRGVGVHAAGVVIGNQPLDNYIPLSCGKGGETITQFEMGAVSELGLLKMDFLGLKTLTVIRGAEDIIKKDNPNFSISTQGLDDKKTYDLLNRGETCGVFQLESGGMVNLCRQFGIDRIEDIIALIALYRPGPMDLIPDYIERKSGRKKVRYIHPLLKEISQETYGILIYQEQVIKAANLLAAYSLGDGDQLRRAMGKKKPEIMAKERRKFVEGCKKLNKIPEKQANKIFDLLEKFAGYGFNKSHSAAYGLISYQTAYLKANYPLEFMASLLNNEINNTDKISVFVAECQRMQIEILPPCVNQSDIKFIPDKNPQNATQRAIRFGLAAIKNIGSAAMQKVIIEREENGEFESLEDFARRLDSKSANKKSLENLVKAGAFDFSGEARDAMFARIDEVLAQASSFQRDKAKGQVSLFGEKELQATWQSKTKYYEKWPQEQSLALEKELLGFYVTGHPLDPFHSAKTSRRYKRVSTLQKSQHFEERHYAVFINEAEIKYTKKDNRPFAIMRVEDYSGNCEAIAWPESYDKNANFLKKGKAVILKAKNDQRSESPRLIVNSATKLPKRKRGVVNARINEEVSSGIQKEISPSQKNTLEEGIGKGIGKGFGKSVDSKSSSVNHESHINGERTKDGEISEEKWEEKVGKRDAYTFRINLHSSDWDDDKLSRLRDCLLKNRGSIPVELNFENNVILRASKDFTVQEDADWQTILGEFPLHWVKIAKK